MVRTWICLLSLGGPALVCAQEFASLKTVAVPAVPGLDHYVRDRQVLLVLGKALFWDMQVGSDGRTACATCHFQAGADHRSRNQFSNPDGPFQANRPFSLGDFPFRVFADIGNNHSPVLRDSSQRAGSQGAFCRTFAGLNGSATENGTDASDAPAFQIGNLHVRQVTPRNAPSVINAVFKVRNFRDGRASAIFTGRTPFGDSDTRQNAVTVVNGQLVHEKLRLTNSSLASQAVAPPMNTVEMSYQGRTWADLAKKLLPRRPLEAQHVAPDDSVLGPYANDQGPGLQPSYTYLSLVQSAFQPAYWDSSRTSFPVAEYNFPIFFGVAIQAYESTLIADDTRFDQFMEGNRGALSLQEQAGFLDFQTTAFCQFCHNGPELSRAGLSFAAQHGAIDSFDAGQTGPYQLMFSDTGFFNTGVRPASEDPGLDALDDFGVPISEAARESVNPLAIAGAFNVPALRNVEFTGPYFHNGGQATLAQVIDFYSRGGDFPDLTGIPVEIIPVPFDTQTRTELLAFLNSLTDERVRYERAPFDHPEICVAVGYPDAPSADPSFPSSALDRWAGVPAVGRFGNAVPLQTFEEQMLGIGADGSRAHNLSDPCAIP